ncbi:MAG: cyclic nucleotide-binding domain-containing protein [bacterium]|nr:cyclic nucleotide-binding domain-containing protein [bacterium]
MASNSGRVLDLTTLAFLRSKGREVRYDAEAMIVRRGDIGRALSIITAGEVEVRLPSGDGGSMTVCRLSPGEPIGEISLLRDAPTSADVVALGPVTVIEIPRQQLQVVLAECEPLRRDLMARLATNLHRTTMESWHQHERAETFAALAQGSETVEPIVAESARMKAVVSRIAEAAHSSAPVLISGEPGTGKRLIARHIHNESSRRSASVIIVDCEALSEEAISRLFASFGGTTTGEHFGALHLAHSGTLALHHAEALGSRLEMLLENQSDLEPGPDVRLILTCEPGHLEPIEPSNSDAQPFLAIEIPPLRHRHRDIVPLAHHLLSRHEAGRHAKLEKSAEHALVRLHYRRANVAELNDVVDLAARCAEGDLVGAEHIFGGIEDGVCPEGVNLGRLSLVDQLTRRGWSTPLRGVTAAGFAVAIVLCLFVPLSAAATMANGFIWGLWEPAVFALFLLAGPLWCMVCPLSTAGRAVKRISSPKRAPPTWLRQAAPYLAPLGFFVIIWSEIIFRMTRNPPASAIMLIALVAASVACCLVYSREVWCAFLCPLGRLASTLASAAPITVAADREICTSTCVTHECYRGSDTVPGCTVYHHPQQTLDAHRCKLCLDCLRSCPHGATTLRLRAPLRGTWRLGASASGLMPFALSVFLLTPLLLATQSGLGLSEFLVASVIAFAIGIFGAPVLSSALCPWKRDDAQTPPRVAVALLILGWGPLIAYQLGHVPVLGTLHLTGNAGTWFGTTLPLGVSVLTLCQTTVILLAAAAAQIVLSQTRSAARFVVRGAWWAVEVAALGYVIVSLVIVALR